jgi:hypothetical protein
MAKSPSGASAASLNTVLSQKLPGLQAADIKSVAKAIAKLQGFGVQVDDVFPEGIIAPDAVTISGNLPAAKRAALIEILSGLDRLKNINVFPRGIPVGPDIIRVKATIQRG